MGKNTGIRIVILMLPVLLAGCAVFENNQQKIYDACNTLIDGMRGDIPKLESILTQDFVYEINPSLTTDTTFFTRQGFIDSTANSPLPPEFKTETRDAAVSGTDGSANIYIDYNFHFGTMTWTFTYTFETSLKNKGSVTGSKWMVNRLYAKEVVFNYSSLSGTENKNILGIKK